MEPPDKRGGQHEAGGGHNKHHALSWVKILEGEDGKSQVHTWSGLYIEGNYSFFSEIFLKFLGCILEVFKVLHF